MVHFLIQVDSDGIPTTGAGYACVEAVRFRQWRDQETDVMMRFVEDAIQNADADTGLIVPVGSIEFAERVLGRPIRPINVPRQLQTLEFAGRYINEGTIDDYRAFCRGFGIDHAFIKSMERCKDDLTNEHFAAGKIRTQFSTPLPSIEAEWRVFVYRGRIVGCRPYDYTEFVSVAPNQSAVLAMIKAYTHCPPAYTLDVAVCDNKTFVVECHNFISCGLYGFDRPDCLLQMLTQAWKYESAKMNQR